VNRMTVSPALPNSSPAVSAGYSDPGSKRSNHQVRSKRRFWYLRWAPMIAGSVFWLNQAFAAAIMPADAARFLRQSTFGATLSEIAKVQQVGFSAYLDTQFHLPVTQYPLLAAVDPNSSVGCPTGAAVTCYRDNYSAFPVENAFFRNALNAPDQLRQHVAFALGQIFVISNVTVHGSYAIREYQQMLANNAFGNFRTLLQEVTLSPAMGDYLSMVNNDKANTAKGTAPNENYAREVMQLFTIGLEQLNLDGSVKLDASGKPIPTYDQDTIDEFSRVYTGWTYPTAPGNTPKPHNPPYYVGDMIPVAANHDSSSKVLLNGVIAPAGLSPSADLDYALNLIFNHPNVGPMFSKAMIQFLVTSNPSPGYIARVATVFNNDGTGVRGNMAAVIRAVLLDPEARASSLPNAGQLREPALFVAGVTRALGGSSDGVFLNQASNLEGQQVFNSPTVFNFYPPDYPLPDNTNGLVAPQFGIENTATALARWNFLNAILYGTIKPDPSVAGATGTSIDLSPWLPLSSNVPALIDSLDTLLSGASLDSASRAKIQKAVEALPATDALARVRSAAFLIAAAPQTLIQR
jgi:uncharacterized protein (DUF1800 family)